MDMGKRHGNGKKEFGGSYILVNLLRLGGLLMRWGYGMQVHWYAFGIAVLRVDCDAQSATGHCRCILRLLDI
jgi:hypothetical protein